MPLLLLAVAGAGDEVPLPSPEVARPGPAITHALPLLASESFPGVRRFLRARARFRLTTAGVPRLVVRSRLAGRQFRKLLPRNQRAGCQLLKSPTPGCAGRPRVLRGSVARRSRACSTHPAPSSSRRAIVRSQPGANRCREFLIVAGLAFLPRSLRSPGNARSSRIIRARVQG